MSKKGENIYKRKDGRWEGRVYLGKSINGKASYRSVYGKTYGETKRKLSLLHANTPSPAGFHCSLTVKELFLVWLDSKKHHIKESTYATYMSMGQRHILPFFGDTSVSKLTSESLKSFANTLLDPGYKGQRRLSRKTVRDILILMRSMLNFACQEYHVAPVATQALNLPKAPAPRVDVLSAQERGRLSQYLQQNIDSFHLGILLCLNTGLRLGEICALKWGDISLEEGMLHIERTMQRIRCFEGEKKTKVVLTSPKTDSSVRDIPLPPSLLDILRRSRCEENAFIFTGSAIRYLEPRTVENRFRGCLYQCGLRMIRFHTLRHTFATHCIESGFDPKTLSEILGHSSVQITLNRYVHSSLDLKRKQMSLLAI